MNSRSFRVVALAVAIVTMLIGSVPMMSIAEEKATEIASRSSVSANDVQIASRGDINLSGRGGEINLSGRGGEINLSGRGGEINLSGRS